MNKYYRVILTIIAAALALVALSSNLVNLWISKVLIHCYSLLLIWLKATMMQILMPM